MQPAKMGGVMRTFDPTNLFFLAILIIGGVAAILLDSWLVFGALVLLSAVRLFYGFTLLRQRR